MLWVKLVKEKLDKCEEELGRNKIPIITGVYKILIENKVHVKQEIRFYVTADAQRLKEQASIYDQQYTREMLKTFKQWKKEIYMTNDELYQYLKRKKVITKPIRLSRYELYDLIRDLKMKEDILCIECDKQRVFGWWCCDHKEKHCERYVTFRCCARAMALPRDVAKVIWQYC